VTAGEANATAGVVVVVVARGEETKMEDRGMTFSSLISVDAMAAMEVLVGLGGGAVAYFRFLSSRFSSRVLASMDRWFRKGA
jgi:hypothetical protein